MNITLENNLKTMESCVFATKICFLVSKKASYKPQKAKVSTQ